MNKNKHVIDMIFPIALFFVFISSCFIVLILKSSYSQGKYTTYLYEDKGYLKELFISNQLEFGKDDGKKIMPVSHLKMQQINPYLYHFSCIVDHKEINTNVAIQSK